MKPKFKKGDKVDFVNDYGVVFEGKTVIEIDKTSWIALKYPEEARYYIEPVDSYWVSKPEKNLRFSKGV